MSKTDRRSMLGVSLACVAMPGAVLQWGRASDGNKSASHTDNLGEPHSTGIDPVVESTQEKGEAVQIKYLEIVTTEVDAICESYAKSYGVTFGEADPSLGNARTAELADGGKIGVRAPMRDSEEPIVRPYFLVKDIKAAVKAAAEAGAEVAIPPMEIPNHGTFAIVIQGGINSGFWQD